MGLIVSIIAFAIIFYLLRNAKNILGKIFVFIIVVIVLAVFMALAKG